ncbi:MAG: hypothetical protein F6K20_25655, partial [Moorea sp. SIO2C4]|nr:hypothetical protein [Moorena sp. SIO2C4]
MVSRLWVKGLKLCRFWRPYLSVSSLGWIARRGPITDPSPHIPRLVGVNGPVRNTDYPLPITHYLLPITHYLLPITYYLLPITYYLL